MADGEIYYDSMSDVPSDYIDPDESDAASVEMEDIDEYTTPRILQDAQNIELDWSDFDAPRMDEAFSANTGPQVFPDNCESVDDVTRLFIGDDMFEMLVEETNRYHAQSAKESTTKRSPKTAKWSDITFQDMKRFFGLLIIMTQVRKSSIHDYWSTNPLIETPIFSKTMTRQKFFEILMYLHFEDNTKSSSDGNRLFKVQKVIDYFLNKFQTVYKPKRDITIDESVILWRGKLPFKTKTYYRKSAKHGILSRMLCEAGTGYISNLKLFTGDDMGKESIVKNLLGSCANIGHHLYINKSYNSVSLAQNLQEINTKVCGIIKRDEGFPERLNGAQLQPLESRHSRMGEVLAQVWKNEKGKDVRIISTIHTSEMVRTNKKDWKTGKNIKKPKSIIDYYKYSLNPDGHLIASYPLLRKTNKWTKKVVLYMFNCAIFNSYVVHSHLNDKKMKYEDFMLGVARAWLEDAAEITVKTEPLDVEMDVHPAPLYPTCSEFVVRKGRTADPPSRLSADMRVHKLEKMINPKSKKRARKRCRVCMAHGLRRESDYMCASCQVALHPGKCFEDYHTKKKY